MRAAFNRNFGGSTGTWRRDDDKDKTYYVFTCQSDKCAKSITAPETIGVPCMIRNDKDPHIEAIFDIISYLFYYVNDGKDVYGEKNKNRMDTLKEIAFHALDNKTIQRKIICAQISDIKRKNYAIVPLINGTNVSCAKNTKKGRNDKKEHLFGVNYNSPRTMIEVIACCYEEDLLKKCLSIQRKGKPCKEIYLPEACSDLNKLKSITIATIGILLCMFDWSNHKQKNLPLKDSDKKKIKDLKNKYDSDSDSDDEEENDKIIFIGERRTRVSRLTNAFKGYVKIEFWRAQPMIALLIADIINGVGLVFGVAGNFYGPMLFIWRYILKWTNQYFDAYYELNGHQGRMNLDNTLPKADEVTNLMFRAFLKDTLIDAIETDCTKKNPWYKSLYNAMVTKNKYENTRDTDKLCAETRTYRENLFRKHCGKFIDYRTKHFNYNLYHLAALKNKGKYLDILTEEYGDDGMTEKCYVIDEREVPKSYCDFTKSSLKNASKQDLERYGFHVYTSGSITNVYKLGKHNRKKFVKTFFDKGEAEKYKKENKEILLETKQGFSAKDIVTIQNQLKDVLERRDSAVALNAVEVAFDNLKLKLKF